MGETPSRSVPKPIYDAEPGFLELYDKAWELAKVHIHVTKGMPAERYMETVGTCESLVKRPFEHFGEQWPGSKKEHKGGGWNRKGRCGAGDGSISVQIIRDNGSLNVRFGGCIGSENVI